MSEEMVDYEISTDISIVENAKKFIVASEPGYVAAGEFKSSLKHELKDREDYFEPLREKAYSAYQEVLDKKRKVCEPYKTAIDIIQKTMDAYLTKIENERREAQRKAEEEARKQAEKERQALLEKAVKAKSEEKQEALLDKAEQVYVKPVIVEPVQPKTIKTDSGVSLSGRRKIEVDVVDLRKLCKFVGDGIVPDTIIDIKYSVLNKWVQSAGIKNGQIPGIIIREEMKSFGR